MEILWQHLGAEQLFAFKPMEILLSQVVEMMEEQKLEEQEKEFLFELMPVLD